MNIACLFSPLEVRGKTFRNRIVMPPMVVNRGVTGEQAVEWYGGHARGGVALVIIEATDIPLFGRELTAKKLVPVVQAIHEGGALAAIQLFPGRRLERPTANETDPQQLLAWYRTAAETCLRAGFDGIEPHGAHGFALNQFFSPELNRRTDRYGGDLQNRMRMALEVVETVKPFCQEMLLLYRHTPVGPGYGIEESLILGRKLVEAGVDILDLSPSSIDAPGDRAAPFKELGIPIITVNNLDEVERAVEVLQKDRADLVAIGRGLIADAEWPNKVRTGRLDEIVRCIKCDQCFQDLREGIPVGCSQWE